MICWPNEGIKEMIFTNNFSCNWLKIKIVLFIDLGYLCWVNQWTMYLNWITNVIIIVVNMLRKSNRLTWMWLKIIHKHSSIAIESFCIWTRMLMCTLWWNQKHVRMWCEFVDENCSNMWISGYVNEKWGMMVMMMRKLPLSLKNVVLNCNEMKLIEGYSLKSTEKIV